MCLGNLYIILVFLYGNKLKYIVMRQVRDMDDKQEMHTELIWGDLWERSLLGDQGQDGMMK